MRQVHLIAFPAAVLLASSPAAAQMDTEVGSRLMGDPVVRAALEAVRAEESTTIDDQVRLCEIPAPPFKEARRAAAYADAFRAAGLRNVRIDREGNVLGER